MDHHQIISHSEFHLHPHPPYDFAASLAYWGRSQEEIVDLPYPATPSPSGDDTQPDGYGYYRRLLWVEEQPVLIGMHAVGGILKLELYGAATAFPLARDQVAHMVALDLDLQPFYRHARHDPVLNKLVARYPGLKPPRTPDPFEALALAIMGQQINLAFTYRLKRRLVQRYGPTFTWQTRSYYAFPPAAHLAEVRREDLLALQFSRQKAAYLLEAARAVASGHLDFSRLAYANDVEVESALTQIKGVGRWTARYVMLRGLGRSNALPAADIGLRNAVGAFYDLGSGAPGRRQASEEEVEHLAETWGEFRGLATFYLWHAYAHRTDLLA